MRSILVLELPAHSSATPTTASSASVAPTPSPDNARVAAFALHQAALRRAFDREFGPDNGADANYAEFFAGRRTPFPGAPRTVRGNTPGYDDTWRAFHPDTVDAPPAHCTLSVGCPETGVCFAVANGQPEKCGVPVAATCTLGLKCDERGDCAADHHDGMVCGRPTQVGWCRGCNPDNCSGCRPDNGGVDDIPCAGSRAGQPVDDGYAACNLGMGCDEHGSCYAAAMGQPDQCGRPISKPRFDDDWAPNPNDDQGQVLRNTDPIDNSGDDADVVGGIERSTLTLMQREDGELQAELSLWWDEPGANPKVPDVVHWGPLARLAATLRRHGVTAAGLVRAMVTAGLPMPTIERAARAMA